MGGSLRVNRVDFAMFAIGPLTSDSGPVMSENQFKISRSCGWR